MRTVPTYRKDVGPRLGFSYQLDPKTVVRGGAGIYFGMSPATNFQYPGSAFRKTANLFFTNDNFATQSATLENPFPGGFTGPQGTQYGQFANWGYQNPNDLGTTAARDANIYQWNVGIQRLLPSQIVLGVDYSANRSTHLPWAGTNNRAFIPSALLAPDFTGGGNSDGSDLHRGWLRKQLSSDSSGQPVLLDVQYPLHIDPFQSLLQRSLIRTTAIDPALGDSVEPVPAIRRRLRRPDAGGSEFLVQRAADSLPEAHHAPHQF